MKLTTFVFTAFAAVFCGTVFAQSLEVTVQTPGLKTMKVPVILTGKQLKEKLGTPDGKKLTVTGKSGKKYDCQLDARDKNGNYVKAGAALNDEDEFVFLADPSQDESYSIAVGTPQQSAQETIKVSKPKDKYFDLELTNADKLSIQVKSSVPAPGSKRSRNDFSKGGIAISSGRTTLTATGIWTSLTVPVQPVGRETDGKSWSKPEIVAEGPVRKIVRITYQTDDCKNVNVNGIYFCKGFSGKVEAENLFCLYASGGIVDCKETIRYAKRTKKARLQWGFVLTPGGRNDLGKEVILPDADKIQIIPLKDVEKKFKVQHNSILVCKDQNQGNMADGYYGVFDPGKKTCVAAFYQTANAAEARSSFELRIAPVSVLNSKGGETVNAAVAYEFSESKDNGVFQKAFRILSCKDQEADFVRQSYKIWAAPESFIKIK